MPETSTLTEKQMQAAVMLAARRSWNDTIAETGVSRTTLSRWLKLEDFSAEVERRRSAKKEKIVAIADSVDKQELDELEDILRKYKEARLQVYRTKLSCGLKGLNTVRRRLDDLPDEAFGVANLAPLLNTCDGLTENALQGWAEMIGLDTLLQSLGEPDGK